MVSETTVIDVSHETQYDYSTSVELAHHLAFLRPLNDIAQHVEAFDLSIDPLPSPHETSRDSYGNARTCFSITHPHRGLWVRASSRVNLRPRYCGFDPATTLPWEQVSAQLRYQLGVSFVRACEFSYVSPLLPRLPELTHYAGASFTPGRPVAQAACELMSRIHRDFRYVPTSTDVATPVSQAFSRREGVCQDFAHVFIACLRSLGLAARYVSGYLLTQAPPGQLRRIGADASHAWVSVYCPSGVPTETDGALVNTWLELDPTNDCWADTHHVRVATGRDFSDVTPLRGVIRGGGAHTLAVRVSLREVS